MKRLILTLLLIWTVGQAQTVQFGQAEYLGTLVKLPVLFDQVAGVGSISCKIDYDFQRFQLVGIECDPALLSAGCAMWGTDSVHMLMGWFSNGFQSVTVTHPFSFILVQVKSGCTPLNWNVSPSESFIGDINSNEIPCVFINDLLCSYTVGIPEIKKELIKGRLRYNLLGQKI